MALISCPECSNQVSDAAASCPACGHPMQASEITTAAPQTAHKPEKKELFKAGGANFVLDEIAAVSSVKTRNWVYLVIALPAMVAVAWGWMSQEWPIAVGITIAGLIVLAFVHVDQGVIASTGDTYTDIKEDMDKVSKRYHDCVNTEGLVVYTGRNTFLDMQFSVNPSRVAEFSHGSFNKHVWLYVIGVIAAAAGFELQLMPLYIVAAALIALGVLSRRAALDITGVGGAKMQLYTKPSDVKRVVTELTQSIEGLGKV